MGRRFVGIEIDEGYVAAAERRIEEARLKAAAGG
jgi:DNA modification methylase